MGGGDPDESIYQAFRAGDAEAIPALIRRHSAVLLRFIHRCLGTGTAEDVEEVLNDTLLAVWRDVAEYDPRRARFKTWVFFQARCAALDRRRALVRQTAAAEPLPAIAAADISWPMIMQVDLVLALEQLGALDRQIVYLCDYLDWDHQRVADHLALKLGTLDSRLQRARQRLRQVLAAWRPRRVPEDDDG
jgi:RNA polymerase sigma-70 factor (ECF subfamily)